MSIWESIIFMFVPGFFGGFAVCLLLHAQTKKEDLPRTFSGDMMGKKGGAMFISPLPFGKRFDAAETVDDLLEK